MRRILLASLLGCLLLSIASAQPQGPASYSTLRAAAEREYAEKSFARAHALYEEAAKLALSPEERRWVEFRLADTTLRADVASPNPDPRERLAARAALSKLIEASTSLTDLDEDGPERTADDDLTALMHEALGDHFLTHPHERNPGMALQHYLEALDFWAGSSDLERARRRYLGVVWRIADQRGASVPREVLVNAVAIAVSPEDKAKARYLLGQQLLAEGNIQAMDRGLQLFEEVLAIGRGTSVYDDALFALASNLAGERNYRIASPDGRELIDYERALRMYRRLLDEFNRGETQYWEHARNAIAEITTAALDIQVAGTFLPESEQEVVLSWRNVSKIDLSLIKVDLADDVNFNVGRAWQEQITIEGRPVVRSWTHDTKDTGDHRPGHTQLRLEPRLPQGAYVITATDGGARSARQLLLVSDTHILTHSAGNHVDVFVSNVVTGEPVRNAKLSIWRHVGNQALRRGDARTDENGLARLTPGDRTGLMLITATSGARQAYHQQYSYWQRAQQHASDGSWRIYAFTDRPAYRPGETVQWKILARVRDGNRWITPQDEPLEYEIVGPRGEKVDSGVATLTQFGSFWSELGLSDSMALGHYQISFKKPGARGHRGSAQLFQLEEYKLPEFLVNVATPEGKLHRLGDTIEATIEASYYFGGPVANAEVEAVVYQEPLYRHWYPRREYAWLYPTMPRHYGGGTIVKTESLRTDAQGIATISIPTPRDGSDMTYRIEARVVDASRREVIGRGEVRVTRHRYSVVAQPEHYMHLPGSSISIDFKAIDANDEPMRATGTVTVVRRTHIDRPVPPVPMPRMPMERPMTRGRRILVPPADFKDELVLETKLSTNELGEATLTFTPKKEGHYVIRWKSDEGERLADSITAETAVWVADHTTTELGYRSGGLDVIVDRETVRPGDRAAVMLVAPEKGRWVVFSTVADDIVDTQVIRMDGTARLLEIPVDEELVPNFFVVASSVFDRALSQDTESIVVPPVAHFLDVEVSADRDEYGPGEQGTLTVTTRDASGNGVPAEVALAVSDEAVTAIRTDMAGDPRQFFYGELRHNTLQVSAGLHEQRYLLLEPTADEEARIARERGMSDGDLAETREEAADGVAGGVVGGIVSAVAPPPPAPVPPPAAARAGVAESITVTAQAANLAPGVPPIEVQVRSDFRSTAFWKPDLVTDANGSATVTVDFPEALTTWRATARAATTGSQFGMASTTARTNMPLLVRLQAPRFFVVGDRVVVSAVMNNNTDAAMHVAPELGLEGLRLEGAGNAPSITIAPHGEARADWTVVAESMPRPATGADPVTTGVDRPSLAKLTVTARAAGFADAMERLLPVYEHGIDKLIARSGKLRGSEAIVRLELPAERRATELTVQVAPSIAVTMLDALPYLIEFPYGCTEQTMSRFLPAAIVARTIEQLKLGRARVAGKPLDAVTAAGIARLFDMQQHDGSWGWWKESSPDSFMTAYVVWGFALARDAGLAFDHGRIDRAAEWLDMNLVRSEDAIHDQVWMLHALSAWRSAPSAAGRKAFDNVWARRDRLTAYSRALLALTAHRWNDAERARILVKTLEDGVRIDRAPDQSVLLRGETAAETMGTAHWGATGFWWRWYEGPVETTAFALQALVTIDPENKLVEPVMNWLVKNRRGTRWNNTRDTAIALLAMNDYLRKSGELSGDLSYELTVNGNVIVTTTVTAADVLSAPSRITVPSAALTESTQEIRIRRTGGSAPIYFAAEAHFVSLEEPVKAAGNELFVRREYFRLAPRPTLLKGVQYDKVPIADREAIATGARVEVVVTVETKNDYEYLLFEDLKPAGFEAVELQSGTALYARNLRTNATAFIYQELRDRKLALFADRLEQGLWEIRYTLRAEVPGTFHALPLLGQAMYVPDVRANGDEMRVTVTE